ncbi:MAG: MOSC domain-containing protein [Verrucomicrobiota bacterium]
MPSDLRLSGLFLHPVKSGRALSVTHGRVDALGLEGDRRWMVVREDGRFLTQRQNPRLAALQAAPAGGHLELHHPGAGFLRVPLAEGAGVRRAVTVWRDTVEAEDLGAAAAAWVTLALGEPARLVRFPDQGVRPVDPAHARPPARTAFSDGFPLLLVSEASREALNLRLVERGASPVPMSRFRPNLVVAGRGLDPFAEDGWRRVRIGRLEFDVVKPCERCVVTTMDQEDGAIPEPGEPLATLAGFRRGDGPVIFGQNVIHRGHGEIRVGQPVEVLA